MKPFLPAGISHITLRVNDIIAAEKFYGTVLGLNLEKKMGQSMAVFRAGSDTIVLVEAETAYDRSSKDYRVDHFGFNVPKAEIIDELAAYFRENEVTILSGPANRKTGRFIFISDPDGNMIEFMFDKS